MIRITDLCKTYGDKEVLKDFSCSLPDRGFIAITGESGIGKTTLIRIIAGLEEADSGNVSFYRADLSHESYEPKFSMVFQEDRLLKRKSALQNVTIVMSGADKDTDRRNASDLLTQLGLEDDINTRADRLSGGMKRRIAIARALAADADIYIMDEPIKGLDSENRSRTLRTIFRHTEDKLLIMVTHDQQDKSGADMEICLKSPEVR